jgi:hypothetical protein
MEQTMLKIKGPETPLKKEIIPISETLCFQVIYNSE